MRYPRPPFTKEQASDPQAVFRGVDQLSQAVNIYTPEAVNLRGLGFTVDNTGVRDVADILMRGIEKASDEHLTLDIPGGIYRLESQITVAVPISIRMGVGAYFDKAHTGNGFFISPSAESAGVVSAATATTLTVSGAGWTTDEHIDKWVDVPLSSIQTSNQRRRVLSNTSDTLTLDYALDNPSGCVGLSANFYTPLDYVYFENLTVIGQTGSDINSFQAFYANNVRFLRCKSLGAGKNGLKLSMCNDVLVDGGEYASSGTFGCFVYHSDKVRLRSVYAADSGADYNIQLKDCRDATAVNCVTRGGDKGMQMKCSGLNPARNVVFSGNAAYGGTGGGFEMQVVQNEGTLYNAEGFSIVGCNSYACGPGFTATGPAANSQPFYGSGFTGCESFGSTGVGFNINAPHITVNGCRSTQSADDGCRIQKSYVILNEFVSTDDHYNAASNGVAVDANFSNVVYTTVNDLTVIKTTATSKVNRGFRDVASGGYSLVQDLRILDSTSSLSSDVVFNGTGSRSVGFPQAWQTSLTPSSIVTRPMHRNGGDWTSFTDADTTPSVSFVTTNGRLFKTANTTGATTITTFDDGVDRQEIYVLAKDANTTVKNNTTIATTTGADKLLTANVIYKFIKDSTVWREY